MEFNIIAEFTSDGTVYEAEVYVGRVMGDKVRIFKECANSVVGETYHIAMRKRAEAAISAALVTLRVTHHEPTVYVRRVTREVTWDLQTFTG